MFDRMQKLLDNGSETLFFFDETMSTIIFDFAAQWPFDFDKTPLRVQVAKPTGISKKLSVQCPDSVFEFQCPDWNFSSSKNIVFFKLKNANCKLLHMDS